MWVCNCNNLREEEILFNIRTFDLTDADQVYESFDCNPRCGKCRLEIIKLIEKASCRL